MRGNTHIKETQSAKRFANENDLSCINISKFGILTRTPA